MSASTGPRYHPSFQDECSPTTDLILQSSDSTLYRLPNFVLSSQAFGSVSSSSIPVDAPSKVITPLLLILSGLPTPPFPDFETYAQTALLAQSWRVPLGSLRGAATSPRFLANPLAVYALACRCGWNDEADIAARETLSLDLYDHCHAAVLEGMPTVALIRLFQYHRARRELFRAGLGDGFDEKCHACDESIGGGEWRAFKARIVAEIEKVQEDSICSLEMEEWYESEACWALKCKECGGNAYDRIETLQRVRMAATLLPKLKL